MFARSNKGELLLRLKFFHGPMRLAMGKGWGTSFFLTINWLLVSFYLFFSLLISEEKQGLCATCDMRSECMTSSLFFLELTNFFSIQKQSTWFKIQFVVLRWFLKALIWVARIGKMNIWQSYAEGFKRCFNHYEMKAQFGV